jgi:hypothetical protein
MTLVDLLVADPDLPVPTAEPPAPTFVVIPVKGQSLYTTSLIHQLHAQGGFDRVFVYDNAAGTDDQYLSPEHMARMPGDALVEFIPAAGLSIYEMWNAGIRKALALTPRCNVAILNNDIRIGDAFLQRLARGLRAMPTIAAVSGNYDGREFPELVQQTKGTAAGRMDGTGGLAGFAFMVRGEDAPLFDEQYEIWWGDADFTKTLDERGAVYGIVRDALVEHIDGGSKTSGVGGKRLTPELEAAADRDELRFHAKWKRDR